MFRRYNQPTLSLSTAVATIVFSLLAWALAVTALAATGQSPIQIRALPPEELVPPPEPAVKPVILPPIEVDVNENRLDDQIEAEIVVATALPDVQDRIEMLNELIRVQLIFSEQITQEQIDAFIAAGGAIDHIYQSVSYGWNGTIARGLVEEFPSIMGDSLVAVVADRSLELHLKEATQNGRVRPVWASGFAGGASGFSGNANVTIAILDTGVDDSHTDLTGRQEYWNDYTADGETTARDVIGHGSHVTGIALGTGTTIGATPTQVLYTDSYTLSGVPKKSFYPFPIHIPAGSAILNSTATWLLSNPHRPGSTTLHGLYRANGITDPYTSLGSTTGDSPLTLNNSFTASTSNHYSAALLSNGNITEFAVANTATFSGVGDPFNALRGVAPSCRWAGGKVFRNNGTGSGLDLEAAVDDMVTQRVAHNVKVVNMSFGIIGSPGLYPDLRAKVNTMVHNGIVAVCSAGNDGPGTAAANEVDDPGRAGLAITVAASNSINELTDYTSSGFLSPGSDEDDKPDVMAPGGSDYYNLVLSVDSNDADAESASFSDQQSNDYAAIKGTSMSAPFVAGAAALVIDAMQQSGTTWNFNSNTHPLQVKMLLCATATESNANREVSSGTNPTLGRATTPKDLYEGYGLINPDAAVEAVMLSYSSGTINGSTNGGAYDRRAWARNVSLETGLVAYFSLTVPTTADLDLYLYSGTPDSKGNPVILASSTNAGLDTDESIQHTATSTETGYLVIKRVSGNGSWSGSGDPAAVRVASFNVTSQDTGVEVEWTTEAEVGTAGFNVLRAESLEGPWMKVNDDLIPSTGSSWGGASYSFSDTTRDPGTVYWYCVEEVDTQGGTSRYAAHMAWDEGLTDADGDQMPDVWEQKQGIDTGSVTDGNADADADGATNLEEYLAGTSPADAEDCVRLQIKQDKERNAVVLTWPGRTGRTYKLITADSPAGLLADSATTLSMMPATSNAPMTFECDASQETNRRFFRLAISPPQ